MNVGITLEMKGETGVPGFKPYIWKLAGDSRLGGWISDSAEGAVLRLEGDDEVISQFLQQLPKSLPRFFHLRAIRLIRRSIEPALPAGTKPKPFRILGPNCFEELIQPDRAPCPECTKKMLDPDSPYYRYPFTMCEHCGPRYGVAILAPFSRWNSMFRAFPPCARCAPHVKLAESGSPDGNWLASCPFCGPTAILAGKNGKAIDTLQPLESASEYIEKGKIVAVKTYDGFIVLCDAFSDSALRLLRERRRMPAKPISLMARDIESVRKYCDVTPAEESLILSPAAPVVITRLKPGMGLNGSLLCPDYPVSVGVCMPPTALLRLLFDSRRNGADEDEEGGCGHFELFAYAGGPHPVDPEDAGGDRDVASAAEFADVLLLHDLKIWQDGGSSVRRIGSDGSIETWRRSRGLCPEPFRLGSPLKRDVLAFGSDFSAAVALGFRSTVISSQQMGTIRNERHSRSLSLTAERLILMNARIPDIIVCDMDMETYSAQRALVVAEKYRLPLATAQRHHANAITCMVENNLTRALALIFDGGANGPDGFVWGAELMEADLVGFKRLCSFAPVEMSYPKDRSARPAFLFARYMDQAGVSLGGDWLRRLNLSSEAYRSWRSSADYRNTVGTHAALTLFDAVSAAAGIAPEQRTYAIQQLLIFEHFLTEPISDSNVKKLCGIMKYNLRDSDVGVKFVDWIGFFRNIADPKVLAPFPPQDIVCAFLKTVAQAVGDMADFAASRSGLRDFVLSGKVFISPSFTTMVESVLAARGFRVYRHHLTAPDESSVCIGQAVFGGMT